MNFHTRHLSPVFRVVQHVDRLLLLMVVPHFSLLDYTKSQKFQTTSKVLAFERTAPVQARVQASAQLLKLEHANPSATAVSLELITFETIYI